MSPRQAIACLAVIPDKEMPVLVIQHAHETKTEWSSNRAVLRSCFLLYPRSHRRARPSVDSYLTTGSQTLVPPSTQTDNSRVLLSLGRQPTQDIARPSHPDTAVWLHSPQHPAISMPNLTQARCRTIEVDGDFLPSPATKLVVTQYLEASQEPPFWAWIVVGAFLDRRDQVIWSTEVFAAHLDIQLESDDEETQTDVSGDDDVSDSSAHSSALEHLGSEHPIRQQPSEAPRTFFVESPNIYYLNPPTFWDPTRQGPVPGYWQAGFDQSAQRWVHTWQPLS
ncbi:Uncharacterized protein TCAP_04227 [Tolypocladium capitatum]|uniref:Uncharacterized protein n=1 Tax=Tolypocladium capitatum TaxID=45235 RepID=A0A2K3QE96_9HYPO|nr:Uncharacterized protein TCAP_04227 [Tolypocladium capitatum]